MKRCINGIMLICLTLTIITVNAQADDKGKKNKNKILEVKITNLTSSIILTPPIFATTRDEFTLFELTQAAIPELEQIAEGGDTSDLYTELMNQGAIDVLEAGGPVLPGETMTIHLKGNNRSLLTLATMLLPTNDAFIGLSSVEVKKKNSNIFYLHAYDAGTEINDEVCGNIPGPIVSCGGGEGFNSDSGEGFIAPHPGFHGEGEISLIEFNWGDPVAKVTVEIINN